MTIVKAKRAAGLSVLATVALVASLACNATAAPPLVSAQTRNGVTRPSDERNLVFAQPGVVKEILVKAGDKVSKPQVLATQDDTIQQAELTALKADLDGADLQISAAQADLAAKKVELERLEKLNAATIAQGKSNSELDKARVEVQIGEIAVKYRQHDKAKAEMKIKQQEVAMEKLKLICPFDGVVTKVDVRPGEGTDLSKAVVQVVQNEPLWVEVDVPSDRARLLKQGDVLDVRYNEDGASWAKANIIFITSYADAKSNTRRVRMEMKNPDNREAGLQVTVKLPDTQTAAAGQ